MAKNNKVYLEGRLTRDAEMRYSPNGMAVIKFSIAIWNGKDKPALFMNCVAFGETAEKIADRLKKGVSIVVEGKLDMTEYQEKKYWQVIADSVQLNTAFNNGRTNSIGTEVNDDDLPF